jgi:hypothetical protein
MSILPQIPTGCSVMTILWNMKSEKIGPVDSVRGVFFTIVKIQQKTEVMNDEGGRGL